MKRPYYFLIADEDTVTHGNDWIRPLVNASTFAYHGSITATSYNVDVRYSVVGKGCHDFEEYAEPYTIPGGGPTTNDIFEAVWKMVEEAYSQTGVTRARPSVSRQLHGSLTTLDPHAHALKRKAVRNPQSPGTLLVEADKQEFQRLGHGTWLGARESLKVALATKTDARASIFVGSAEGVVTRFEWKSQTTPHGTFGVLEAKGRTKDSGTPPKDYALGYGTWGVAVGEVDGDDDHRELVVGSYNRVAIFEADTLALKSQVEFSEWERIEPRRIQLADIHPTEGTEIILRTKHGRILVMDKDLNDLAEHSEGGIVDLLVGPAPTMRAATAFTKPIYALSARGHVASIEMSDVVSLAPEQGLLSAATPLQYGVPWDLEEVLWPVSNPTPHVAALYSHGPGSTGSIRIFDATNLDLVSEFGTLESVHGGPIPLERPKGGLEGSLAVIHKEGKAWRFVAVLTDYVAVWDASGQENPIGVKNLVTFPPARNAACIEAGDIDGDNEDEVILSTLGGHVVWFELADLTSAGQSINVTRKVHVDTTAKKVYVNRANATLAATWALTLGSNGKLQAVDKAGTWWEVDPVTGLPIEPTFGVPKETGLSDLRGIAHAGVATLPNGSGGMNHNKWTVADGPAAGIKFVQTQPYLPDSDETGRWEVPATPNTSGLLRDGYWLFPYGGDVDASGATNHAAWWWGAFASVDFTAGYPNLVQRFEYTDVPAVAGVWNSTGPNTNNVHPPPPTPTDPGIALRTELSVNAIDRMQCLRVGDVDTAAPGPEILVSAMGGRVIAMKVEGGELEIKEQSLDYGFGGAAMALGSLDTNPGEDVVFAPLYGQVDKDAKPAQAFFYVLRNTGNAWVEVDKRALGDPNTASHDFDGYGACGAAVVNLTGDSTPEIVLTTVHGELSVWSFDRGTNKIGSELFRTIVEGSLGGFNSIVVGDFVDNHTNESGSDTHLEVYVSGSSGIRRFNVRVEE